jgi:flagellar basal-body rod protein FlgF
MDKSLYIAMTGASASLRRQASVANNLANANSTGYKASVETTFAVPVQGEGFDSRVATTARTAGVSDKPGAIVTTGNRLDVALRPDHWLSVQDGQGGVAYTRAGNLQVNSNGQLLTAAGQPVLDAGGQPIAIPPYQTIDIGADGTISMIPEGQNAASIVNAGQLGVVTAPTATLERGDDGLFRAPDAAPAPAPAAGTVLTSGALEGSNVDAAGTLVEMIQLSRSYEASVRVLQAGDENAQRSNSLLSLR